MIDTRDDNNEVGMFGKIIATRESSSSTSTRVTQDSSSQDESCGVSWGSSGVSKGTRQTKEQSRGQRKAGNNASGGVHNRLYARSKSMQEEGRQKRQQIAQSLKPKSSASAKKISAKEATSLFDRLYVSGVQKQISLGRKKNMVEVKEDAKCSTTIISTTEADDLYDRLYGDAVTKQIKQRIPIEGQKPKKIISKKQANSLYERLYFESTMSAQRARVAEE